MIYKFIFIIHIIVSFLLILIIFLQKSSDILQGSYISFQTNFFTNVDVNKKFFLILTLIIFGIFLITTFFLIYCLLNFSVYYENLEEVVKTTLFCNKYFDNFNIDDLNFPKLLPTWWNR